MTLEINNSQIRLRKMKFLSILLIFSSISFVTKAQTLPEMSGETLDNKNLSLPKDLIGKYSLLCFASSQKSEGALMSWLDPVYQKFIAKTGMMDDLYDVNVYFIPILTGINVSFATSMKNKFKESAQEDLRPHVLFCKEEGKDILASLNMKKSDVPHFLLLDKEGKIIYRTTGSYTEEKFDEIDNLIE
jgi:hypothetical protein